MTHQEELNATYLFSTPFLQSPLHLLLSHILYNCTDHEYYVTNTYNIFCKVIVFHMQYVYIYYIQHIISKYVIFKGIMTHQRCDSDTIASTYECCIMITSPN